MEIFKGEVATGYGQSISGIRSGYYGVVEWTDGTFACARYIGMEISAIWRHFHNDRFLVVVSNRGNCKGLMVRSSNMFVDVKTFQAI